MSELGKTILGAIEEALETGDKGRVVRTIPDVQKIRKSLGVTQKQFSARYRINLETLRAWEQKKRLPDTTSAAYLACIARAPEVVQRLLHE